MTSYCKIPIIFRNHLISKGFSGRHPPARRLIEDVEVPLQDKLTLKELGTALRFFIVGGLATVTHGAILYWALSYTGLGSFHSNNLAFSIAFFVSFFGHYHFSFAHVTRDDDRSEFLSRNLNFAIVALCGYLISSFIVYVFTHVYVLGAELVSLLVMIVVPVVSYLLNRLWVFRH